jgi:hypothetical protein
MTKLLGNGASRWLPRKSPQDSLSPSSRVGRPVPLRADPGASST